MGSAGSAELVLTTPFASTVAEVWVVGGLGPPRAVVPCVLFCVGGVETPLGASPAAGDAIANVRYESVVGVEGTGRFWVCSFAGERGRSAASPGWTVLGKAGIRGTPRNTPP